MPNDIEALKAWLRAWADATATMDGKHILINEAVTALDQLFARNQELEVALRGALGDQYDLLHTCRKYAEEARNDDTRSIRHIRADRIEERLNATRAALNGGDRK